MAGTLEGARQFAELIRFSGDSVCDNAHEDSSKSQFIRDALYKSGLLISKQTTPNLATQFTDICEKLHIPRSNVDAFVYSSPEIQAQCFLTSFDQCTVRFSSALVNLLEGEEFAFVAGHEIGHFLLGHGINSDIETHTPEVAMLSRAQEISVDRIGLVACGNIQIAIRALMKTVSGLDQRHLRFDIGEFISQLSHVSENSSFQEIGESHPPVIVRCRALLWFSMGNDIGKYPNSIDRHHVDVLDSRVINDMNKYVDGPVRGHIEQATNRLTMWLVALALISDGKFDKQEQEKFCEVFGDEKLRKFVSFLSGRSSDEVYEATLERVNFTKEELKSIIPHTYEGVYQEVIIIVKSICGH